MKQVSKSTDNAVITTAGLISNSTVYPYDLTDKQLKLYIMYTGHTTPYLSTAQMTRHNKTAEGGLKILDQETNKGQFEILLSKQDLEKLPLTAISGKSLYLALYEVNVIGNISGVEVYLGIVKPDMIIEIVE